MRQVLSVADLTREDGSEFLSPAPKMNLQIGATTYPLARANDALEDLRHGRFTGAAVPVP